MLIVQIGDEFVLARIMAGSFQGQILSIPKIKLFNKGSPWLVLSFYRYQFPFAPAYAMSVNKAQGQTLNRVGVMMKSDMFLHGQLYVALSRTSNLDNLMMVAKIFESKQLVSVVHKSIFKE
jgi:ATP-dependent DNA helicase PIF1